MLTITVSDIRFSVRMKEKIRMTRMGREFEEEKRVAVEAGRAEAMAAGKAEGTADAVRALMASMKLSAKEAMDMLSVPDSMRNTVRMML